MHNKKKEQTQNPNKQWQIHETTTEPPPLNGQQPKPLGGGLKYILLAPNLRLLKHKNV